MYKVSLIIPARNEEKFIGKCLDSIIVQNYPKDKLEVFVIEGMSHDKTKKIVEQYCQKYLFIKLLDNPKKIFPSAVNIGIKQANGEIIMILGAHAVYEKDYIEKCAYNLLKYNADNIGGVLNTVGQEDSLVGKLITYVLTSPFGVGNSTFRTGTNKITEVDTVFGGCYRKEVFEKIGLMNEKLNSSADMEFNVRLKRAGGKILLVPDIKATYYTRSTFKQFIKNNFRNGFWAIYPIKFVNCIAVKFRHFVPLFFVLSIICLSILSFISVFFQWLLIIVLSLYFIISIVFSVKYLKFGFVYFILMPFLYLILHVSYGLASLWGAIRLIF